MALDKLRNVLPDANDFLIGSSLLYVDRRQLALDVVFLGLEVLAELAERVELILLVVDECPGLLRLEVLLLLAKRTCLLGQLDLVLQLAHLGLLLGQCLGGVG